MFTISAYCSLYKARKKQLASLERVAAVCGQITSRLSKELHKTRPSSRFAHDSTSRLAQDASWTSFLGVRATLSDCINEDGAVYCNDTHVALENEAGGLGGSVAVAPMLKYWTLFSF